MGPGGYGLVDTSVVSLYNVLKDEDGLDRRVLEIPFLDRALYRHTKDESGHGFQFLFFININLGGDGE